MNPTTSEIKYKLFPNQILWVSSITWGREKHEYKSNVLGVFHNEHSAIINMFEELVEREWIYPGKEDEDEEYDMDDIHEKDRIDIYDTTKTIKEFYTILNNSCTIHGNSYYKDGWEWSIERFSPVDGWINNKSFTFLGHVRSQKNV